MADVKLELCRIVCLPPHHPLFSLLRALGRPRPRASNGKMNTPTNGPLGRHHRWAGWWVSRRSHLFPGCSWRTAHDALAEIKSLVKNRFSDNVGGRPILGPVSANACGC